MKIALVNNNLGQAGGAERYTHDVAYGLEKNGHQVAMFDLADGLIERLANFQPTVVYLQNVFDDRVTSDINSRFKTFRFIHDHETYCPGSSKYWFRSNQICPVPFSYSCAIRGFTQHCMSRRPEKIWKELWSKPSLLRVTKELKGLVVASEFMKTQLVLNGISPEKITVNQLFVDPRWEGEKAAFEVKPADPPLILFIGRVFIEKGVEYLLRSCRLLDASYQLKIIGDGWDLPRLKSLSESFGLGDKVEFLGWLEHRKVSEYLASCRMLVVPSIWPEPFGIIGLEAMYFGKPVVAFDSGGIATWLKDGRNGFLVPRLDINKLAGRIDELLADKLLADKMGAAGKEILLGEFTIERHLRVLEEVFANASA
ncbi:MAG: glycosyltransferase family 4 protein [bacterium]|nr:glycosyltransferase family 4 protein [bacterium]